MALRWEATFQGAVAVPVVVGARVEPVRDRAVLHLLLRVKVPIANRTGSRWPIIRRQLTVLATMVSRWGEGSPNDDDLGWATKNATPFWKLALGASVPGLPREDSGVYGPTDGRRSRMGGRQVLHFRTNQAGAEAAQDVINEREGGNLLWSSWQNYPAGWPYNKSVGSYNLYLRNCAQFAEDVLKAGNVPGVPGHSVLEPAALWAILAYEQSW